jgi:predicted nucleic acid-binding protein
VPYLIDSDWTIDHLNNVEEALALVDSLAADRLFISVITYMEAFQGTLRDADPTEAADKLRRFTAGIPILEVTQEVAEQAARVREALRGLARRVDSRRYDLLIAATALEL